MYKVVLIDDEEIIVEGLKKVIDWQEYNCEVVATAHDAKSGTEIIRSISPDIVFTDIKMPDQNGLSMLAGIRSEFPKMQVTVLTGYGDFSYAQEAIRLGVSRFLLKPSRMDEIHEALQTMTAILSSHSSADVQSPSVSASAEAFDSSDIVSDDLSDANPEFCFKENLEDESDYAIGCRQSNRFVVNKALKFIKENYSRKITLQDVSDYCYVSHWHLSKLLHKLTNESFYDILNNTRIQYAKELLKNPKLRVNDVCAMVGYSDTGHFSKVFKRVTGMSANEYRCQHSGKHV